MRRGDAARAQTVLVANPGADLYGSDRMLLETVSALRGRGERVVVTVPEDGPLVPEIESRGGEVRICPTPVIRKALLRPLGLVQLGAEIARSIPPSLGLIRNVDPGVILVNTITPPLWLLLAKLSRRPAICHVHEGEASASGVLRKAINLPLLLADRLIVNSEFSRGVLVDALPVLASRAEVVYNSVPGPKSIVPPRMELQGTWRILFVGRLSPRKGPDVAIRALALLRAQGADASLDLVGAVFPGYEWFEHDLRRLVERLGLEERVRFNGFQPDSWDFTAGCDIVVVPSTVDEPFGNTAVEAVLSARPLAVSGVGGLPEAVKGFRAARIVAPGDPQGLADAITDIGSNWAMYRQAAIDESAVAQQRYSARRYADRILAVVDAVRGARPSVALTTRLRRSTSFRPRSSAAARTR